MQHWKEVEQALQEWEDTNLPSDEHFHAVFGRFPNTPDDRYLKIAIKEGEIDFDKWSVEDIVSHYKTLEHMDRQAKIYAEQSAEIFQLLSIINDPDASEQQIAEAVKRHEEITEEGYIQRRESEEGLAQDTDHRAPSHLQPKPKREKSAPIIGTAIETPTADNP
jgi:hypothetical protein